MVKFAFYGQLSITNTSILNKQVQKGSIVDTLVFIRRKKLWALELGRVFMKRI